MLCCRPIHLLDISSVIRLISAACVDCILNLNLRLYVDGILYRFTVSVYCYQYFDEPNSNRKEKFEDNWSSSTTNKKHGHLLSNHGEFIRGP